MSRSTQWGSFDRLKGISSMIIQVGFHSLGPAKTPPHTKNTCPTVSRRVGLIIYMFLTTVVITSREKPIGSNDVNSIELKQVYSGSTK